MKRLRSCIFHTEIYRLKDPKIPSTLSIAGGTIV